MFAIAFLESIPMADCKDEITDFDTCSIVDCCDSCDDACCDDILLWIEPIANCKDEFTVFDTLANVTFDSWLVDPVLFDVFLDSIPIADCPWQPFLQWYWDNLSQGSISAMVPVQVRSSSSVPWRKVLCLFVYLPSSLDWFEVSKNWSLVVALSCVDKLQIGSWRLRHTPLCKTKKRNCSSQIYQMLLCRYSNGWYPFSGQSKDCEFLSLSIVCRVHALQSRVP